MGHFTKRSFTFWDCLFGTYAKEDTVPTYGITSKIRLFSNLFYLNFHEFSRIIKDVRQAKSLKEKLFLVFGSPAEVDAFKRKRSTTKKLQSFSSSLPIHAGDRRNIAEIA